MLISVNSETSTDSGTKDRKTHDFPDIDELIAEWGDTPFHIARKGATNQREKNSGLQSKEMGRGKNGILDEQVPASSDKVGKKEQNYLAILHLARAWRNLSAS